MSEFKRENLEMFLGAVRKYMQLRGQLSQKDLAEQTDVGVSTMSRFLAQKTTELNSQLIAKIVSKLKIPLHEIIDFVDESFADQFIRLVKFYNDEKVVGPSPKNDEDKITPAEENPPAVESSKEDDFLHAFGAPNGGAKIAATANINIGGKTVSMPFVPEGRREGDLSIKDKIERLTPRQKAYLTDFLNLDLEGRDLMVDLGNSLFRYFKQKGMTF